MIRQLRSRLTYANVVATAALFVALGGSAYAGLTITGRDVKNGSLTGRDVKNSSLTGRDVRNSSLRSRDVRNRSLLAKDFKRGQLPAGPAGPPGPGVTELTTGPAAGATGGDIESLTLARGRYLVVGNVLLEQPAGAVAHVSLVGTVDAIGGQSATVRCDVATDGGSTSCVLRSPYPGNGVMRPEATLATESRSGRFDTYASAYLTAIKLPM